MILFKCDTLFQLISVINIKINYYMNEEADIIFSGETDFSGIVQKVRDIDLFRNVYFWKRLLNSDLQPIINASRTMDELLLAYIDIIGDELNYSDYRYLLFGSDINSNKLLFYLFLKRGCCPGVVMYDEGITSYLSFEANSATKMSHLEKQYHRRGNFYEAREMILLYMKDHMLANREVPVDSIPKISMDSIVCEYITEIFGNVKLPNQRYIFLEQCFLSNRKMCDDVQLLDWIANKVGKENIIVKLHPRTRYDRFSERGYAVWRETIPLEAAFLNSNMSDTVLLTVSSTGALSNFLVFASVNMSIWLDKLVSFCDIGVSRNKINKFISGIKDEINSSQPRLLVPQNIAELDLMLDYIELWG